MPSYKYLVPIELDRSDWEPLGLCHPWPWESIREKGSTSTPIVLGQPGEPVAFEGHFPPLLKAFPTSSEEWMRARRKSQGLVYLFMSCLFCPAFYLKVTCWVSVGSWDHNSPVYAVFKIIVYSFFNSPWRWRVYRPSSFKRTIIKQRFPCKWLVSKWDSFHHTALTPYCSHTQFCWEAPSLHFWWVATTLFCGVENIHPHIVTGAITAWTFLMFCSKTTAYSSLKGSC